MFTRERKVYKVLAKGGDFKTFILKPENICWIVWNYHRHLPPQKLFMIQFQSYDDCRRFAVICSYDPTWSAIPPLFPPPLILLQSCSAWTSFQQTHHSPHLPCEALGNCGRRASQMFPDRTVVIQMQQPFCPACLWMIQNVRHLTNYFILLP